jgi:hypothetical protein
MDKPNTQSHDEISDKTQGYYVDDADLWHNFCYGADY